MTTTTEDTEFYLPLTFLTKEKIVERLIRKRELQCYLDLFFKADDDGTIVLDDSQEDDKDSTKSSSPDSVIFLDQVQPTPIQGDGVHEVFFGS